MNKNVVNPIGLKGNEQLHHIQELMGKLSPVNESVRNSVVELTKKAADGKIYAIVRENHNYFIKIASQKKGPLVTEDFQYIGGLMNKTSEVFPTYAKALKRLNGKLISIAENAGAMGEINTFANEHLMGIATTVTEEEIEETEELDEEVCEGCSSMEEEQIEEDTDVNYRFENSRMSSIARAMNEDDSGYVNTYVLPRGIDEVFESLDDIKKKNLAENTQELDEIKYKLKVPVQQPVETPPANSFGGGDQPAPEAPISDVGSSDGLDGPQDFGNGNPADSGDAFGEKEPFDAGVAADEESDPKHFLEQLAGKMGTSLRQYTKEQGQPDFELEKFVINSVISATHTSEMEPNDQDDIISKIKKSGQGDDEKSPIPEPEDNAGDDMGGDEIPDQEPTENENIVMEFDENIAKNLPIGENFSTFVEKSIMEQINRKFARQYLNEVVEEVFSIMGKDTDEVGETEPDVETAPTKVEPDTETPQRTPTRRKDKKWEVRPDIQENPDPKAIK